MVIIMAHDFVFPDVGEGIHEGEIIKWRVKEGDQVQEHQVIADIETDKAVVEIPSPKTGTIIKLHAKEGDIVKVGQVLATIGEPGETKISTSGSTEKKKFEAVVGELEEAPEGIVRKLPEIKKESKIAEQDESIEKKEVRALPYIRDLAKKLGVDISKVKGTGTGGIITELDVKTAALEPQGLKIQPQKKLSGPKFAFEKYGQVLRVPLGGVRKAIAKNMIESNIIPQATYMDEADITKLEEIRERSKKMAEDQGIHLTFLAFIAKAIAHALKEYPYLNSSLDEEKQEIVLKKYYNLGIAVDTSEGLIVPVVKDVDKKSIIELAKDMQELSEKARDRTLKLEELQGGTFTITNIGSFGGTYGVPLINPPEAAILSMGRAKRKIIIENNKTEIKLMLPISLTFDHRILDGAHAARFLNEVKRHLEDPDIMLVHVI